MRNIPESDWKKIRDMKNQVLSISCNTIFEKIDQISCKRKDKEHESYLKLWKLLNKEDTKISIMFDDLKRSNAVMKLAIWKHNGLISDEKMAEFTNETQQSVELFNQSSRCEPCLILKNTKINEE